MRAPIVLRIIPPHRRGPDPVHVRYIATSRESGVVMRDDAIHAAYLGERPGSHGLFGADDRPINLAQVDAAVKQRQGPSWAMVISLREDDAADLDMDHADWQAAVRRYMVEAARVLSPDNPSHLRWVAAYHEMAGHPHVHILAWLDRPERRQLLTRDELRHLRKAAVRAVAGPSYVRDIAEKTAMRDLILLTGKRNLAEITRSIDDAEREITSRLGASTRIPPTFSRQDLRALAERLRRLDLPGRGQAKLAYMPPELRAEIREIADWILGRPSLAPIRADYERAARAVASYFRENTDAPATKALDDIRDRLAQQVLRAAVRLQADDCLAAWDRQTVCNRLFRAAFRLLDNARSRAEAEAQLAARRVVERQDYFARERE